jgi:hypothetical protein
MTADPTSDARAALRADLTARVTDLLSSNRVVAAGGRYTRPARRTYPHQWLWDSCFHAIVYHLLGDRAFAHDELRALFRAQVASGPDRGRLPHMTFFGGGPGEADQDPEGARAYARQASLWGDPRASTITQPPIVAEAVLRVGDAALWRELWRPLAAYAQTRRHRTSERRRKALSGMTELLPGAVILEAYHGRSRCTARASHRIPLRVNVCHATPQRALGRVLRDNSRGTVHGNHALAAGLRHGVPSARGYRPAPREHRAGR